MNETEHLVAGADVVDDDPEAVYVDDFREHPFLLGHLLVDTVKVLLATDDIALDALLRKHLADLFRYALYDLALAALALLECAVEHAVAHRVQVFEPEVLEFDLESIDAETVRNRRVDIERLAGNTLALAPGHRLEGLHVVQAVGELHEYDPDVLDHREHHLAEALGLRFGSRTELDLVELADAVDEQRDLAAELLFDIWAIVASVSSTVSCRIAAIMASESRCISASDWATATGCEMYASPVLRVWPSWASAPNS